MAKPNHAKRSRPRSLSTRRHRVAQQRSAEQRARRAVERWRRRWAVVLPPSCGWRRSPSGPPLPCPRRPL